MLKTRLKKVELVEKLKELKSLKEITEELGICKATLHNAINNYDLQDYKKAVKISNDMTCFARKKYPKKETEIAEFRTYLDELLEKLLNKEITIEEGFTSDTKCTAFLKKKWFELFLHFLP